jgi:hypothetical protein
MVLLRITGANEYLFDVFGPPTGVKENLTFYANVYVAR